jgi:hypothetical protein
MLANMSSICYHSFSMATEGCVVHVPPVIQITFESCIPARIHRYLLPFQQHLGQLFLQSSASLKLKTNALYFVAAVALRVSDTTQHLNCDLLYRKEQTRILKYNKMPKSQLSRTYIYSASATSACHKHKKAVKELKSVFEHVIALNKLHVCSL